MDESGLASFIARSLDAIEHEVPAAWLRLCEALDGRSIRLVVDGEAARLRGRDGGLRLDDGGAAAVDVRTAHATILELLDGRVTLLDALLDDRIVVRGAPEDVLGFHDALICYLHGGVRSPSFRPLLDDYRGATARRRRRP